MISFAETNEKNKKDIIKALPPDFQTEVAEYIDAALDFGYDGVAVCYYKEMLLLRVLDGGIYSFISPLPLTECADEKEGIVAIREYAVKEDIPLLFADVPYELYLWICDYFASVEGVEDDGIFTVAVNTPANLIGEIPKIETERLTLKKIEYSSRDEYYRLSTEPTGKRYYGYSYADDTDSPTPDYFYSRQAEELEIGLSITLGVHLDGALIGECVLHRFDLIGGAEISLRLLPEFRSQGFGREILTAIIEKRESLFIKTLYATVHKDNAPSNALFSSLMHKSLCEGENIHYEI